MLTESTEAVSVVLTTALLAKAAVVPGNIAATMIIVLLLAAAAKFPTKNVRLSGFEEVVSDAEAGIVTAVPFTVALITRIPSGISSTT